MKLKHIPKAHWCELHRDLDDILYSASGEQARALFDAAPIVEGYYIALTYDREYNIFCLQVFTL